jgi:iron complex outermembrane receptor protein
MKKNFHWGSTLFIREGDDLIDWIRENPESPWKAENIGEVRTKGMETILSFPPLSFSYAYLEAEKGGEIISKYALDHLRHHFSLGITHSLFGFSQNLKLSYKERVEEGYFLLDARISKKINNIELFLQGTNLLNTSYREREEVPMPGTWIQGGIKIFL